MTSLRPTGTRGSREKMDKAVFTIGRLAQETGCKIQTIRYYEEIGVMPEPERSRGNQRLYGQVHIHRLMFIRHSRELGFSLDDIRELLDLADKPNQSCESVTNVAKNHLNEVNSRISRLNKVKSELERMIGQCNGKQMHDCRIIEALAHHQS